MHNLESHNQISFKVKWSRHSCLWVNSACVICMFTILFIENLVRWSGLGSPGLFPLNPTSSLLLLPAGDRGALGSVHFQSVTGSRSASGCPFTAHGLRHVTGSVSGAHPTPLLPPSFNRLGVASHSSVWFFSSFLPCWWSSGRSARLLARPAWTQVFRPGLPSPPHGLLGPVVRL